MRARQMGDGTMPVWQMRDQAMQALQMRAYPVRQGSPNARNNNAFPQLSIQRIAVPVVSFARQEKARARLACLAPVCLPARQGLPSVGTIASISKKAAHIAAAATRGVMLLSEDLRRVKQENVSAPACPPTRSARASASR